MQELKLMASNDTLYTVLNAIENQLDHNGCPKSTKMEILISVEEVYVNIAHYAYGGHSGEVIVQMDIVQDPKKCRVVFRDKGIPYNPLNKKDPDITLPAEEREIGGLGIFMMKEYMDRVDYRYEDGYNILTMEKDL